MRESESTDQSDTSVAATRPGPGRMNGGMSFNRTTRSQAATPSASVMTGSATRDHPMVTPPFRGVRSVSLIFFSRCTRQGTRKRLRGDPAMARIFGRSAKALIARIGRVDGKLGEDPARSRCHHNDPVRQVDGFKHGVGHEDHGVADLPPQLQKIIVELEARDLVKG